MSQSGVGTRELSKNEVKRYLLFRKNSTSSNLDKQKTKREFTRLFLEYAFFGDETNHLKSPVLVSWDITSKCNSKCKICYYYPTFAPHKEDLSLSNLKEIAHKLHKGEVLEVTLGGGEPLIRKDFENILKTIKEYDFFTYLLTNGILLQNTRANKIYALLDDDDMIQISLDGATRETYLKQRGIDAFDTVVKNISNAIKNGVATHCNCVATSLNSSEIPKIYELCSELGVGSLTITMPAFLGRFKADLFVHQRILVRRILETLELKEENGYKTQLIDGLGLPYSLDEIRKAVNPKEKNLNAHPHCLAGTGKAAISSIGDVYPCTFAMYPEFNAGNLLKDSLEKIWNNSKAFAKFRGGRDLSKAKCSKCKFVNMCRGGCPGVTKNCFGDVNHADPRCMATVM